MEHGMEEERRNGFKANRKGAFWVLWLLVKDEDE
jgi:hypothetical protein